jgi:O-antigen ligase
MGLDVLKNNFQMFVLMIFWLVAGLFTGQGVLLFIPITIIIIFLNEKFPEILIGFIFILVLSDSLEDSMAFAKSFKNIYILLLFFFFIITINTQETVSTFYKYFIPYFIFGLIGLMYSPIFFTSFQKLLSYALLFITVPNYVIRSYQIQGEEFFRNLAYFLLAIIVAGFLIRFYNLEIAYSHGGRLRGLFGNPNGLGIFMILFFILFIIINSKYPDLFSRLEKVIFILIMFYVLYKTGSRTALLAVVLFLLFHQVFRFSAFFGFVLFFALMISIEFLILYFPKFIVAIGMQKSMRIETLQQGSGRLLAWEFAWKNIQDSLFIGKGIAYDEYLMRSNREMLSKAGHEGGVHNTYLIMWLNTGLLGLLAFLRGFFLVFMRGAKNNSFAFPAMFAIMLSINFEPWLAASLNPFTILFLIIITLLTEETFNKQTEQSDEEEMEEIAVVD